MLMLNMPKKFPIIFVVWGLATGPSNEKGKKGEASDIELNHRKSSGVPRTWKLRRAHPHCIPNSKFKKQEETYKVIPY